MALKASGSDAFTHRIARLNQRANAGGVDLLSENQDIHIWIDPANSPPTQYNVWILPANFNQVKAESLQNKLKEHHLEACIMSHIQNDHPLVKELHVVATRDGKLTSFATEQELDKFLIEDFYGGGNSG